MSNIQLSTQSSTQSSIQSSIQSKVKPYTISINFCCGCGFHTTHLESAVEHCESTKHSIPVTGWIRYLRHIPTSKVERVIKSQTSFETKFDDLRSKLSSLRNT